MAKLEQIHQTFDKIATVPKLLFLAMMAVALCSLGPLSIFAPVPLSIAFLLYGRVVTYSVGLFTLVTLWSLSAIQTGFPPYVAAAYLVVFIFAILISEIVKQNAHPVKGLFVTGLLVVTLVASALMGFDYFSKSSLKAEISKSVSTFVAQIKKQKEFSEGMSAEDERRIDDLISKPETIINEIYSSLPQIVFVSTFFGLWISLYVTLRNSVVWRYKNNYNFSLADLTHFKVPDYFVYPLIFGFVLILAHDQGLPKGSDVVGTNIIYCLGVFYLFQGFGVYNDFLKFIKIGGFIKTLFIAFTLIFGFRFLALLGLFDLWFDFRKYFINRKKDEGDII
jgi:hypothetical protein